LLYISVYGIDDAATWECVGVTQLVKKIEDIAPVISGVFFSFFFGGAFHKIGADARQIEKKNSRMTGAI
jgi:hypothetical protein